LIVKWKHIISQEEKINNDDYKNNKSSIIRTKSIDRFASILKAGNSLNNDIDYNLIGKTIEEEIFKQYGSDMNKLYVPKIRDIQFNLRKKI